jgi:hypothetical protein
LPSKCFTGTDASSLPQWQLPLYIMMSLRDAAVERTPITESSASLGCRGHVAPLALDRGICRS